jgi:hypothetical protein
MSEGWEGCGLVSFDTTPDPVRQSTPLRGARDGYSDFTSSVTLWMDALASPKSRDVLSL